jgi:hypothetical protein
MLICETKALLYAMKGTSDMSRINEYARRIYENVDRKVAYNKIVGLLMRFVKRNGWDDVDLIDWENILESGLEMDELVEVFKREYPQYRWDDKEIDEDTYNHMLEAHAETLEHADPVKQLEDSIVDLDFRLSRRIEELEKLISSMNGQGPRPETMPHDLGPLRTELETLKTYVEGLRLAHKEVVDRMAEVERAAKENAEFVASLWSRAVNNTRAAAHDTGAPAPRAPPQKTTAQKGPRKGGGTIRLILGGAIAVVFNAIAMPMLAYSNGWSDTTTFFASMFTTMAMIGLMILEGLWVNTVFTGPRASAKGFIAGYVYSQHVNPYKQR